MRIGSSHLTRAKCLDGLGKSAASASSRIRMPPVAKAARSSPRMMRLCLPPAACCGSHGMTTLTLDRYKGRAFSYGRAEAGFSYRLDENPGGPGARPNSLRKPSRVSLWRRMLFNNYVSRLVDSPVTVPFVGGRFGALLPNIGVHLMSVLLPAQTDRRAVMEYLKKQGIQTSIHYPLVHEFAAYRDSVQSLPRTEQLGRRQLSLPFYPGMQIADVDLVVGTLLEALESCKERRAGNEQAVETSN